MAADQDLIAANQRIAELEGAQRTATQRQAISAALRKYELVPGGAEQLTALLEPVTAIAKGVDGRDVVVGPGYTPIEGHVNDLLKKPEYAHYVRASGSPFPVSASTSEAPAARPHNYWEPIRQPGENLGVAMTRTATEQRVALGPDPRLAPGASLIRGLAAKK